MSSPVIATLFSINDMHYRSMGILNIFQCKHYMCMHTHTTNKQNGLSRA